MSEAKIDGAEPMEADPHGTVKTKGHPNGTTIRVTPPIEVREAAGIDPDESWAWFHVPDDGFYLHRQQAGHFDIPDDFEAVGSSWMRQNGRYVDTAIPQPAIEAAGVEPGQRWTFHALGDGAVKLTRAGDDA